MLDFVKNEDHAELMKITLTAELKIALEIQHRQNRDRRVCDRIRCVLLCCEGWSPVMIAQSQRIDETTVRRHLNDWLNEEKLKPVNGGSQSHLSETQTADYVLLPCLLYAPLLHFPLRAGQIRAWYELGAHADFVTAVSEAERVALSRC